MKASVERVAVSEPQFEDQYVLRLTKEEAQFLYDVTRRIGGAHSTRRHIADELNHSLKYMGIYGYGAIDVLGIITFRSKGEDDEAGNLSGE